MARKQIPTALPKVLTIGQLATRGGIAASALRFYESQGLSLDEIKQALDSLPEGRTPTAADWESLAGGWQAQIAERIRLLERLRDDLGSCIGCGCLSLENCALYNPDDAAYLLGHGAQYLKGRTPADAGVTL